MASIKTREVVEIGGKEHGEWPERTKMEGGARPRAGFWILSRYDSSWLTDKFSKASTSCACLV